MHNCANCCCDANNFQPLTSDFTEVAKYVLYGFATLTCCLIVLSEIVYLSNNAKVFKNDVPHLEEVDNEQEQCINFKNE